VPLFLTCLDHGLQQRVLQREEIGKFRLGITDWSVEFHKLRVNVRCFQASGFDQLLLLDAGKPNRITKLLIARETKRIHQHDFVENFP
jgi:hypothetical protein